MTLKRSEPNKNTWQKQMTDGPTKTSATISSLFSRLLFKASVCTVSLFLAHFSMSLPKTNDNGETESGKAAFLIYLELPHQNTRQAATQMEKDQTVQLFCKVSLCQRHVLVQPEMTPYWHSHLCCFHSIFLHLYFSHSLVLCASNSATFWADK